MAQQINLYPWIENTVQGVGIEGGFSGLSGKVIQANGAENGLEWGDTTGNGALVRAESPVFTGPVTFSDTTTFSGDITTSLSGAIALGTGIGGVIQEASTVGTGSSLVVANGVTGTGNAVLSDSPTITGTLNFSDVVVSNSLTTAGFTADSVNVTGFAGSGHSLVMTSNFGDLDIDSGTPIDGDYTFSGGITLPGFMSYSPSSGGRGAFFSSSPVAQPSFPAFSILSFADPVSDTATFNAQMADLNTWLNNLQGALGVGGLGLLDFV